MTAVVAADSTTVRAGARVLCADAGLAVDAIADRVEALLERGRRPPPAVIICDRSVLGTDAALTVRQLADAAHRVVVLDDDHDLALGLAGAVACVSPRRQHAALVTALQEAAASDPPSHRDAFRDLKARPRPNLTARQREIATAAAHGLSNAEIAAELCVAPDTVKTHLKQVNDRLGARNRTHAVVKALLLGLLGPVDI